MNRHGFHRETGVSRGLREPTEGPHEPTRCHFDDAYANRQHLTLCCTGIGLRELHGLRFIVVSTSSPLLVPSSGHVAMTDGRTATTDAPWDPAR